MAKSPKMPPGLPMKGMMPPGKPGPKPVPGAAAAAKGRRRGMKPAGAKPGGKLPPFMR